MTDTTDVLHNTFANMYGCLIHNIQYCPVDIKCRGRQMAYEITNAQLQFTVEHGISIYSNVDTRAFPIKFAIAELLWILAGRNDVESIVKWNKAIVNYSDDMSTMNGAYGYRLSDQIMSCTVKLVNDIYSRQACAVIWRPDDIVVNSKDHPCNVFLQFLVRDNRLHLTVTARSIDFITGLPIDAFHWQALLMLVCNSLRPNYPGLRYGIVTYNIGSLHVYEQDADILRSFESSKGFDYEIWLDSTYSHVRTNAQSKFAKCKTLMNLSKVLELDIISHQTINKLDDIFKNRKHKFQRGGTTA